MQASSSLNCSNYNLVLYDSGSGKLYKNASLTTIENVDYSDNKSESYYYSHPAFYYDKFITIKYYRNYSDKDNIINKYFIVLMNSNFKEEKVLYAMEDNNALNSTYGIALSPDRKYLYFVEYLPDDSDFFEVSGTSSQIKKLNLSKLEVETLLETLGTIDLRLNAISPNGNLITYTKNEGRYETNLSGNKVHKKGKDTIYLFNVLTRKEKKLDEGFRSSFASNDIVAFVKSHSYHHYYISKESSKAMIPQPLSLLSMVSDYKISPDKKYVFVYFLKYSFLGYYQSVRERAIYTLDPFEKTDLQSDVLDKFLYYHIDLPGTTDWQLAE
jgi:hypothetical protein